MNSNDKEIILQSDMSPIFGQRDQPQKDITIIHTNRDEFCYRIIEISILGQLLIFILTLSFCVSSVTLMLIADASRKYRNSYLSKC